MKKLFAITLLVNLNLYTMERIQKEYVKLINMDGNVLHDKIYNTSINDLKRNVKQRKRNKKSECFRCWSEILTTIKHCNEE